MPLILSEEAQMVRETAMDFFRERSPITALRKLRDDNDPDGFHVLYTHHESISRRGKSSMYEERRLSVEETEYGLRTQLLIRWFNPAAGRRTD